MVAVGGNCHRIDMVFDVYFGKSIRNLKRQRRSPCEIQVKNIEAGHRITQWKEILANSDNKTELIKFLFQEWKKETCRKLLGAGVSLYITSGCQCLKDNKRFYPHY